MSRNASRKNRDDEDDNYYDEEDFEEFETASNCSKELSSTPVSKPRGGTPFKKSIEKPPIESLNLESYMEMNFDKDLKENASDQGEDLRPLDGIHPTKDDTEQVLMRKRLGYSESTDGLSPIRKDPILYSSMSGRELPKSSLISSTGYSATAFVAAHSGPSPVRSSLSREENAKKAPSSPMRSSDVDNKISELYNKLSTNGHQQENHHQQSRGGSGQNNVQYEQHSPLVVKDHPDNAARVDALLLELFPERMAAAAKKKPKAGKKDKQAYGLGAVRAHDIAHYINVQNNNQQQSRYHADEQQQDTSPSHHLQQQQHQASDKDTDQQVRALRKELKVKDEKLARVTEHSMMMASHMDRLKGEVALLTMKLRDAEMELEAKEARLGEALKQRKKASKKVQQSSDEVVAGLGHENLRLKEREQALMDAVEELSTQNQDLIVKLKQSMQRELELSSKRAALISSTVAGMADNMSNYHLPHISKQQPQQGEAALYRAQSEPTEAPSKRGGGTRKKKG